MFSLTPVSQDQRSREAPSQEGLELTDRINLSIASDNRIIDAINNNLNYICSETLANDVDVKDQVEGGKEVEIDDVKASISIHKLN